MQRVYSSVYPDRSGEQKLFYDSKTILQEIVQADMEEGISYHLIKEEGPDHNKSFTVEVKIGETVYGTGSGRTKKQRNRKPLTRQF